MNNIELKSKLHEIKNMGWVDSLRKGDTGVGYTLETLLGIDENNDSAADIDGKFEIKGMRKDSNSLKTHFSQRPIWIVKPRDIIRKYGQQCSENPERINCYSTLQCGKETPQGLKLEVRNSNLFLKGANNEDLAKYPLEVIHFRYEQKFTDMVMVLADRQKQRGKPERFLYNEAYHCNNLSLTKVIKLLKQGKMKVDLRMWLNKDTNRLRDRGTAFRMKREETKELYGKITRLV